MHGQSLYHRVSDKHAALVLREPALRTTMYPPLQSDMPYDVMIGYVYLDSIVRSLTSGLQLDSVAGAAYDSDTLRWTMKYIYEMVDWDPITMYQYLGREAIRGHVVGSPWANAQPYSVFSTFLTRVAKVIPDSGATLSYILHADVIAHVTVTDTFNSVDLHGDTEVRVRCSIVDPIKGNRLILCYPGTVKDGKGAHTMTAPGDCLEFQYAYVGEARITEAGVMTVHRFPHWIIPGNDYIVFLQYQGLGGDSTGRYMTLMPILDWHSTVLGMYPVRSGSLYDPSNDFGYGTSLAVDDFKARLRSTIKAIIR